MSGHYKKSNLLIKGVVRLYAETCVIMISLVYYVYKQLGGCITRRPRIANGEWEDRAPNTFAFRQNFLLFTFPRCYQYFATLLPFSSRHYRKRGMFRGGKFGIFRVWNTIAKLLRRLLCENGVIQVRVDSAPRTFPLYGYMSCAPKLFHRGIFPVYGYLRTLRRYILYYLW